MKHKGGEGASVRSGRISNPLRNSKIVKCEGNCENLFSKIAEPNPIFYKDRKSRMQKQIIAFSRGGILRRLKKLGDRKHSNINIYRFIARNRSRTEQRNRNRPGLIPESITIPKAARSNFKHGIIAVSGAFWMRNGPSPFRRKGARKGANYKRDHRQRISDRRIRAAIVE